MKKFFLLSVLFIFMGNVSANQSTIFEVIDRHEGANETVMVFCIADKVFVQYASENSSFTLTQVMDSHGKGTMATTFTMSCKDYKKKMNK